jgi:hypothetical protein
MNLFEIHNMKDIEHIIQFGTCHRGTVLESTRREAIVCKQLDSPDIKQMAFDITKETLHHWCINNYKIDTEKSTLKQG